MLTVTLTGFFRLSRNKRLTVKTFGLSHALAPRHSFGFGWCQLFGNEFIKLFVD